MAWLNDNWQAVLDVVATVGTVLAAVLAWLAIRQGNLQAKAAADALVRERRIDFEVERLLDIDEAVDKGANTALTTETIRRSLMSLPDDELPHTRLYVGLPTRDADALRTKEAVDAQNAGGYLTLGRIVVGDDGESYLDLLHEEVQAAIRSRVLAR